MNHPIRALFLCTGNSTRSQMAEGLLRSSGDADFEVHSAGIDEAMCETGIDISRQESKSLERHLGQPFDYIITVCDRSLDRVMLRVKPRFTMGYNNGSVAGWTNRTAVRPGRVSSVSMAAISVL